MAKKKSARERAEEKKRFFMYLSYKEQMDMLTDEELGRLMRYVYDYIETGEKKQDVPLVNMLLSVITVNLDMDKESYVESVQENLDNASKGGNKSAEVRRAKAEQAKQKAAHDEESYEESYEDACEDLYEESGEEMYAEENSVSFNEAVVQKRTTASKNQPPFKNEPDRKIDRKNDRLIDRLTDREKEETLCNSSSRGRSADESDEHALIFYGANQRPTTSAELHRSEALTDELYSTYMHNKPTRYDYECIFERVHERAVNADGEAYAAYSQVKADLLRYVFKTAAEQQKLGWYYMDGILKKCEENGVKTAEEALQHEYRWKRGEIA